MAQTEQSGKYSVLTFVSGKGGVGKTSLAASVGWCVSLAKARVMIIDLDLRNLGATALFTAQKPVGKSTVADLIHQPNQTKNLDIKEVAPYIWFLRGEFVPASQDSEAPMAKEINRLQNNLKLGLNNLQKKLDIDLFILDCHGGIDTLSIASGGISDKTLIVTEADPVTFGGTLRLMESYLKFYEKSQKKPNVEYVINRVNPRYSWMDLDNIYQKYLEGFFGHLTSSNKILAYLPQENFLSEGFGQYPFLIELAKHSVLRKKIELLIYDLFAKTHPDLVAKSIIENFSNDSKRRKIHRNLLSNETRATQSVISLFALTTTFLTALGISYLAYNIFEDYFKSLGITLPQSASDIFSGISAIIIILIIMILPILTFFNVLWRYRDELVYERGLYRVLYQEKRNFRRFRIIKYWLYCVALGIALTSWCLVILSLLWSMIR